MQGYSVRIITNSSQLKSADLCIVLGYTYLLDASCLSCSSNNIVIHESDLPLGKGWSPMTWQIIKDCRSIVFTLFEASSELDKGNIYLKKQLLLNGTELIHEWRELQALTSFQLILEWLSLRSTNSLFSFKQSGDESFYPRRTPKDSEIDPNLSLSSLFDKLRIADPLRYPTFFSFRGKRFKLTLEKF